MPTQFHVNGELWLSSISVFVFIFHNVHANFASKFFIAANVYINKNIEYKILQHDHKIKFRLLYSIVKRQKDYCDQGTARHICFGADN